MEDLFVQIYPARINRRLLVSGFSSDIETEIQQRLHSYVTDDRLRIRYCPWLSGTSTMERHWEAEPDFPSDPYSEPDVDTYRTLLTDVLRTFPAAAQELLTRFATIDGQQGSSAV